MKNILFLLAAFSLAFSACKKDDNDGSYFRFKVDGAQFEASDLLAYAVDFDDYINLYGVQSLGGNEVCYVSIPKATAPGAYTFNDTDVYAYYTDSSNNSYSSRWGMGAGSVTIDEIDAKHVKGSFQFTAYDSATETVKKTISGGTFDVQFR